MTDFQYQVSMAKRDAAVAQALNFLNAGDTYMFTFWSKVARAFEAEVFGGVESRRQA